MKRRMGRSSDNRCQYFLDEGLEEDEDDEDEEEEDDGLDEEEDMDMDMKMDKDRVDPCLCCAGLYCTLYLSKTIISIRNIVYYFNIFKYCLHAYTLHGGATACRGLSSHEE